MFDIATLVCQDKGALFIGVVLNNYFYKNILKHFLCTFPLYFQVSSVLFDCMVLKTGKSVFVFYRSTQICICEYDNKIFIFKVVLSIDKKN